MAEVKLSRLLSLTLMKNCDVAEFGSLVRAIATVPGTFLRPALLEVSDSIGIGGFVGFCLKSVVKPPPWIMKPSITRWNCVPS